jgi:hypothetical protein
MKSSFWTHPSVLALAKGRDPVEAALSRAQEIVFEAIEEGWSGPPFDPFELARLRKIAVTPSQEVPEARLMERKGHLFVDYNPLKPKTRVRYSIAHEVAHTIFPDFAQKVRFRNAARPERADEWQLEMLCNLAAAEFLMPISTFPESEKLEPSIENLLKWRQRYTVSTEAALLRLLRISNDNILVFSARTIDGVNFRFSYVLGRAGAVESLYGARLRTDSPVADCSAIGFSAKGTDLWSEIGKVHLECVGIAPYPGSTYPRVVGFASRPKADVRAEELYEELIGNAMRPRGEGPKLLVHIVNDKARSWGAGFGKQVSTKFPLVAAKFREQLEERKRFRLGEIFATQVDPELTVVQMVAQQGYGASENPRLRYMALRSCLQFVALLAREKRASVHMPPIGTGYGGGSWTLIRELVEQELSRKGISVKVYSVGQERSRESEDQPSLF